MRLRWVSATQCRCVHQLIPYQTWNTLCSLEMEHFGHMRWNTWNSWEAMMRLWGLLTVDYSSAGVLTTDSHHLTLPCVQYCILHCFTATYLWFSSVHWPSIPSYFYNRNCVCCHQVTFLHSPKLSPSTVQQVSIYPRKSRIQTILSECFSAIFTAREKTGCRRWRSPDATRKCAVKANSLHVSMKLTKCLTVNFDNTCEDRRWILPHFAKQGFVPSHHGRLSDDRDRGPHSCTFTDTDPNTDPH